MNKLNLLIVEDDPSQQDDIVSLLNEVPFISVTGFSATGDEMIRMASQPAGGVDVDALLLDADLGEGKNGLESYSILRLRGVEIPAVLVTDNVSDAGYAFDLGLIDVLEKPLMSVRFRQAMERLRCYVEYRQYQKNGGILVPVVNDRILQLPPSRILFIESVNRKVFVHTVNATLETKIPLKTYECYLKDHAFVATHRSYLVNFKMIDRVGECRIHFKQDSRYALASEEKKQDIRLLWEMAKF